MHRARRSPRHGGPIFSEQTHRSSIAIDTEHRARLAEGLNLQLAALVHLHSQVKQAHWNVRGRFFYARHELFDDIAAHLLEMVDDVAERVGALGFYAEGTTILAAEASYLPPFDHDARTGQEVVRMLVDRFRRVEQQVRAMIPKTEDALADPITADLLTAMLRTMEKDMWFLEAHLEGPDAHMPQRAANRAPTLEGSAVRKTPAPASWS